METGVLIISILITVVGLVSSKSALPNRKYSFKVPVNTITDIQTSCDSQNINITISTAQPFKGVAFAKDFAQECKTFGNRHPINLKPLYNLKKILL